MNTDTDIQIDWLPESLRVIVEGIGLANTLRLVERYGGIRVYIKTKNYRKYNQDLIEYVGQEAAEWLAKQYHGTVLELPRAKHMLTELRNAEIIRRSRSGEIDEHLAREFHLTRRGILKIKARAKKRAQTSDTEKTLPLFG